jgi:hypothetical protein
MVMKRFLLVLAVVAAGACNKPTADECRQAITNMETLLDEGAAKNFDVEGEVRRCRGGSTKEAVTCAIKAKSKADLDACSFRAPKSAK